MAKYRETPCKYYIPLANMKKADLPATRTIVGTEINMNQGQK